MAQPDNAPEPVLIAPQSRSVTYWPDHRRPRPDIMRVPSVRVEKADVSVDIQGQAATTTLVFLLRNDGPVAQETQLLVPVPEGAAVRSFQLDSVGSEPTANLLPIEEARAIYQSIVSKAKDPGLLEFVGSSLIRSSVFPVPTNGTNTVRLTYEELLKPDGDRLDYVLVRSESVGSPGPSQAWRGQPAMTQWSYSADIKAERAIASVTSASHEIDITRPETVSNQRVLVKSRPSASGIVGPFRLSVLLAKGEQPTGTVVLCPDSGADTPGGYFMLLVSPPPEDSSVKRKPLAREVTLVIDRSGSMRGEKLHQAKAAAMQVLDGLAEGERFNIIDYSDTIQSFSPEPVQKTAEVGKKARAYIEAIEANGGTNIHDAVIEALRPKVMAELPIILFLTDGLPTVGVTQEAAIRQAITKANAASTGDGSAGKVATRRIFTFGVGLDVNVPLLSNLATESRATSTFVLPDENVEVKVSQVYRRLAGPVLGALELKSDGGALKDVVPQLLPDVFEGDQLVVLGRYQGSSAGEIVLTGIDGQERRELKFALDPSKARVQNAYVSRLWARQKIAFLIDQIRKAGESGVSLDGQKELIAEVVRLSTKFGILSEYTAFLAIEPGAVASASGFDPRWEASPARTAAGSMDQATTNMEKVMAVRSGAGAVAQQQNLQRMQAGVGVTPTIDLGQTLQSAQGGGGRSPFASYYVDKDMKQVEITGVQLVGDLSLFARPGRWVDSQLFPKDQDKLDPEVTIEFGSKEYDKLADELAKLNRAGVLVMAEDVYLLHGGKRILVKGLTE